MPRIRGRLNIQVMRSIFNIISMMEIFVVYLENRKYFLNVTHSTCILCISSCNFRKRKSLQGIEHFPKRRPVYRKNNNVLSHFHSFIHKFSFKCGLRGVLVFFNA